MAPTAKEFLSLLWGEQEGVAELYTIPRDGPHIVSGLVYPLSLDPFVDACARSSGKVNVHMGVCLRKIGTEIGWDPTEKKSKRGTVESVLSTCAVWVDIDFKKTPREKALPLVKTFPLQPSMIVLSGGGVHLYWLLKEPATGDDLAKIKPINQALVAALSADPESVDLARVLRVPDTLNLKYDPPALCRISEPAWHPELRYGLSDFDFLSPCEPEQHSQSEASAPQQADHPTHELSQDKKEKIVELLKSLWTAGWRHEMALDVAGAFAHAGISETFTCEVVRAVSDSVGGDTEGRLRDVVDTYKRMAEGKEIKGFTKLEERIESEFVGEPKENAKKALATIKKLLSKRRKARNFTVERFVKFDSRPARWRIELKSGDRTLSVEVDSKQLASAKLFKEAAIDQANFVMPLSQAAWDDAVSGFMGKVEVREAPREATSSGAIESALEDFLKERKSQPTIGDLSNFAGYDENEVFFKVAAFKTFVKESGVRVDNQFYDLLVHAGWKNKAKRFGSGDKDVVKVWIKPLNGQTNGQSTLFQPPEKPLI